MATTNQATRTIGTKLIKKNSGSEPSPIELAGLTKIGEIGVESEEIEVTDLKSDSGYKEFIAGVKDAGEVSLEGYIKDEAQVEKLLALAESRQIEEFTVEYPSGAKWIFKGFIKSFKDGEKTPDGMAKFTASIRVTGKPAYTKSA